MTVHWPMFFAASVPISLFALSGWVLSLARNNAQHVDSMWPLFIAMSAYVYALFEYALHPRSVIVLVLVTLWALRLCAYLTWRQMSLPMDRRHAALITQLGSFYWIKSFYHLFLLYGLLAWLISLPLFASIQTNLPLNHLDSIGTLVVALGLTIETIADWQMQQFRKVSTNKTNVLSTGLWRYCRHPNYFGELLVWLGFFLIALATGAWWASLSPMIVLYLIFYGSGIPAVENNILERRPAYAQYQRNINAIIPF